MFNVLDIVSRSAINVVTSPIRVVGAVVDLVDGLSEAEIRVQAIVSLGREAAVAMTTEELLGWYEGNR